MSIITQTFLWWLVCAVSGLTSFELIQVSSQLRTQFQQQQLHHDLSQKEKWRRAMWGFSHNVCLTGKSTQSSKTVHPQWTGDSQEFKTTETPFISWSIRHIQLPMTFNTGTRCHAAPTGLYLLSTWIISTYHHTGLTLVILIRKSFACRNNKNYTVMQRC